MAANIPDLGSTETKVFTKVRKKIAMPLLEIAADPDINDEDLKQAVDKLVEKDLIKVEKRSDPLRAIVSVNQKYL
jgi:predicted ArsR family transcriptional regulator